MSNRKLPEDYYAIAKANGLEWLGPEVPNGRTKTEWRCPKGHTWFATFTNIQQGSGCPHRDCDRRRKTPMDYHNLATRKGFRWLGPFESITGQELVVLYRDSRASTPVYQLGFDL